MDKLSKAKKSLELERVVLARKEMEYKILEREADIERLKENIEIQKAREEELRKEIF